MSWSKMIRTERAARSNRISVSRPSGSSADAISTRSPARRRNRLPKWRVFNLRQKVRNRRVGVCAFVTPPTSRVAHWPSEKVTSSDRASSEASGMYPVTTNPETRAATWLGNAPATSSRARPKIAVRRFCQPRPRSWRWTSLIDRSRSATQPHTKTRLPLTTSRSTPKRRSVGTDMRNAARILQIVRHPAVLPVTVEFPRRLGRPRGGPPRRCYRGQGLRDIVRTSPCRRPRYSV